jgi:hypothetical protein
MEGIQVKQVDFEEKSIQEKEAALLEKYEQEQQDDIPPVEVPEVGVPVEAEENKAPQFGDEDVLSYIKSKFNKDISSFDDLFQTNNTPQEVLPEDVNAFLKFKKETGRGLDDFYRVNQDYSKESPERLIASYLKEMNPEMDDEDIQYEISERFGYDEELDEERDVKKKKLAYKKELTKATNYFNEQKEKYKTPLESMVQQSISNEDQQELATYREYRKQLDAQNEFQAKRSEHFVNKTNELFSNDFKGFDFKIGDKEFTYKPGDADKIKNAQMDISKFFNDFVDENGLLKDAKEYHKTIAVAMNKDAFARFFYEQGKAEAIEESAKQSKNIDMGSVRTTGQPLERSGFKVTALDNDHGSRLKIK